MTFLHGGKNALQIMTEPGLHAWRYFTLVDFSFGEKKPEHPLNKSTLGTIEIFDFAYMMGDAALDRTPCITYPEATHLITRSNPEFNRLSQTIRRFGEIHQPSILDEIDSEKLQNLRKQFAPSLDTLREHFDILNEATTHLLGRRRIEQPNTFLQSAMDALLLPYDFLRVFLAQIDLNRRLEKL